MCKACGGKCQYSGGNHVPITIANSAAAQIYPIASVDRSINRSMNGRSLDRLINRSIDLLSNMTRPNRHDPTEPCPTCKPPETATNSHKQPQTATKNRQKQPEKGQKQPLGKIKIHHSNRNTRKLTTFWKSHQKLKIENLGKN